MNFSRRVMEPSGLNSWKNSKKLERTPNTMIKSSKNKLKPQPNSLNLNIRHSGKLKIQV
jgi:hypothetical protein